MKKILLSLTLLVTNFLFVSQAVAQVPTYSASPSAQLSSSRRLTCDGLAVDLGSRSTAPAEVFFTTTASNLATNYIYHFGDGTVIEDDSTTSHTYDTGGEYFVYVEVEDADGKTVTSSECQAEVSLDSSSLSTARIGCGELAITSGNNKQAPTSVGFTVSAVDNKNNIRGFEMDFGDETATKSAINGFFTHRYENPGSYVARAYTVDSNGNKSTSDTCAKTVTVLTKPLTVQPETGTPIEILVSIVGAGLAAGLLLLVRRLFVR